LPAIGNPGDDERVAADETDDLVQEVFVRMQVHGAQAGATYVSD
jgi:DNA-directed RNA polymerase specialized sigma24 family protein